MLDGAVWTSSSTIERTVFDGIGEADALVAAGIAADLRVDADHAAVHVEQRPAGVAVIDRGIGLDRVVDREVVRRRDLAVERADDPRS